MATYGFDENSAERIAETVRRSENTPRQQPQRRGSGPRIDSNLLEIVRVTSATQTSGRHPGQIQVYDEAALTASDLSGTQDCWVCGINGETLTETKYLARRQEHAGSPSLPVFRAVAAVGSSLTVEEADGSPSYAGVTKLIAGAGFVVSQPAAGQAKFDPPAGVITGSRTVYKYACVSGSLTEYSAAVTITDGWITAWASSYT